MSDQDTGPTWETREVIRWAESTPETEAWLRGRVCDGLMKTLAQEAPRALNGIGLEGDDWLAVDWHFIARYILARYALEGMNA